jgi:hypothetical protein
MNDQFHVPAALPSRKELLWILERRLSGFQNRYERSGEERRLVYVGNRFPIVRFPSPSLY